MYDRNTGRDEIVLDVEFVYEGDASANFTLQAGTVNREGLRAAALAYLILLSQKKGRLELMLTP